MKAFVFVRRALRLTLIATTALAAILIAVGAAWEYFTRSYLQGFSDAIVPLTASPHEKLIAILGWMNAAPAWIPVVPPEKFFPASRNPKNNLEYEVLLLDCGSATNAFLNLANSVGLRVRRLLLLNPEGRASHIVAEVFLDGRWIVVDPYFHVILKDPAGRPLTRGDLADPEVFRSAMEQLPPYAATFAYGTTAHIRVAALPFIGSALQRVLDQTVPGWRESWTVSLLLDRSSYEVIALGVSLLLLSLFGLVCLRAFRRTSSGESLSIQAELPGLFDLPPVRSARLGAFYRHLHRKNVGANLPVQQIGGSSTGEKLAGKWVNDRKASALKKLLWK